MSFEPKIVGQHQEPRSESRASELPTPPVWDDAEALGLSDGLAALAEQLRDDAQHLAACHPADATREQRAAACGLDAGAVRRRFWNRFARLGGAAAAILLLPAGWILWNAGQPATGPRDAAATSALPAAPRIAKVRTLAGEAALSTAAPSAKTDREVSELPGASGRLLPASFLQDVSGPELDGMLDLLEQEDAELSI